jgi:hypothetical protein
MAFKLNMIIGSTRPGWIYEAAIEHDRFDVELVDLADFGLPLLDESGHPKAQQYAHEPPSRGARAWHRPTPSYL